MADIKESGENYLEAILRLEDQHGQVRSVDVANYLGVTRPSVNKAVAALKEAGMVEQEHYGQITLTEDGRKLAMEVNNRHHILRAFLVQVLGVKEETAEADACRMEHIISEETFQGIRKMLRKAEKGKK